ncbi:hypothetical protein EB093_05935 [bacterium]|nr:hypothetical protein [bacterium]
MANSVSPNSIGPKSRFSQLSKVSEYGNTILREFYKRAAGVASDIMKTLLASRQSTSVELDRDIKLSLSGSNNSNKNPLIVPTLNHNESVKTNGEVDKSSSGKVDKSSSREVDKSSSNPFSCTYTTKVAWSGNLYEDIKSLVDTLKDNQTSWASTENTIRASYRQFRAADRSLPMDKLQEKEGYLKSNMSDCINSGREVLNSFLDAHKGLHQVQQEGLTTFSSSQEGKEFTASNIATYLNDIFQ